MENIINTTLLGLFFGTFGTTIGGIIGATFKSPSNKFLSFILQFAAGLMSAIICFELIPEAMEISHISNVVIGIFLGIIAMILCDNLIKSIYIKREKSKSNSLLKTGIIVGIGLAIHNFPEGLAIGSGFESSLKLGYSLALAIAFHDIPERNINVCTNEKWWYVENESDFFNTIIRCNNRNRSIFWCNSWRYF